MALAAMAAACGSVPNDPGDRLFPPAGVIRGTVFYEGPHPCSRGGHIVGNAIVVAFDRRNPPPPRGVASTPVNFADVTGDRLFASEPRYAGEDAPYCPADHGFTDLVRVSADFAIAPLAGGSYELHAFFDYTGDFLPEFKFRDEPVKGDSAGGFVDTLDALAPGNAGNPDYKPRFLPVDVGIPRPLSAGAAGLPGAIPSYDIPGQGFVADNVTVTIGTRVTTTRPYFYAQGESAQIDSVSAPPTLTASVLQSSDQPGNLAQEPDALESASDPRAPHYLPVLTIPQDLQVLAPPDDYPPTPAEALQFEASFPRLRLPWGVPDRELGVAKDPGQPFHMQIAPVAIGGGFLVWQDAALDPGTHAYVPEQIAEGGQIPSLWPLLVLTKLVDDYAPSVGGAFHNVDPASTIAQGDPLSPVIVMQGITLAAARDPTRPDTLLETAADAASGSLFDAAAHTPSVARQDHLTVLLRPSVICFDTLFDPANPDKRGTLVTPYLTGPSADVPSHLARPILPADLLSRDVKDREPLAGIVRSIVQGCLPRGRYAMNLIYPSGQAWTVPNEAGACSGSEGPTAYASDPVASTCAAKPRPILYSQGNRAVVEVVAARDPTNCQPDGPPDKVPPVPLVCLPRTPSPP
jgi:hypothetical protein